MNYQELFHENLCKNNLCLKEKFESVLQIFVNRSYSCSYFLLHGFNRKPYAHDEAVL